MSCRCNDKSNPYGTKGDIINRSIIFTKVCKEQIKLYGRSREAIVETINICKSRNILKEYLESREKKVVDIRIHCMMSKNIEKYVENEVFEAFKLMKLQSGTNI